MQKDEADIHIMMNMYWEPLDFTIPPVPSRQWHRVLDTSLDAPDDIVSEGREIKLSDHSYPVEGRSVVVLISR